MTRSAGDCDDDIQSKREFKTTCREGGARVQAKRKRASSSTTMSAVVVVVGNGNEIVLVLVVLVGKKRKCFKAVARLSYL